MVPESGVAIDRDSGIHVDCILLSDDFGAGLVATGWPYRHPLPPPVAPRTRQGFLCGLHHPHHRESLLPYASAPRRATNRERQGGRGHTPCPPRNLRDRPVFLGVP